MELVLVRHALPVRRRVDEGPADPGLSTDGHAQAQHLAAYLSNERLHAVYSSPLRRALETAAPVAGAQGLTVEVADGVAEWDREDNEYVPVEELKAANDPRWQALVAGTWSGTGETADQFAQRVVEALGTITVRHPAEKIAVVCHGGVINAFLAHVLDLPWTAPFFYPNYTSLHRVAIARSGERSIVTVNETPHLRGSGLPVGLVHEREHP